MMVASCAAVARSGRMHARLFDWHTEAMHWLTQQLLYSFHYDAVECIMILWF